MSKRRKKYLSHLVTLPTGFGTRLLLLSPSTQNEASDGGLIPPSGSSDTSGSKWVLGQDYPAFDVHKERELVLSGLLNQVLIQLFSQRI